MCIWTYWPLNWTTHILMFLQDSETSLCSRLEGPHRAADWSWSWPLWYEFHVLLCSAFTINFFFSFTVSLRFLLCFALFSFLLYATSYITCRQCWKEEEKWKELGKMKAFVIPGVLSVAVQLHSLLFLFFIGPLTGTCNWKNTQNKN